MYSLILFYIRGILINGGINMFQNIIKVFHKRKSNNKISSTEDIVQNNITLHGEDPGIIPPDDNPNPLVNDSEK
jgi:hypothetical protein